MSSYLTSTEISVATGIMKNTFDTFVSRVVVHKEPIKTIVAPESENVTFGYGQNQNEHNYTYTPISGVYSGVFSRSKAGETELERRLKIQYAGTNTTLKVRQDCYDYISSGQTEKIAVAGASWRLVGSARRKMFLTDLYYVLTLEEIQ